MQSEANDTDTYGPKAKTTMRACKSDNHILIFLFKRISNTPTRRHTVDSINYSRTDPPITDCTYFIQSEDTRSVSCVQYLITGHAEGTFPGLSIWVPTGIEFLWSTHSVRNSPPEEIEYSQRTLTEYAIVQISNNKKIQTRSEVSSGSDKSCFTVKWFYACA